MSDRSSVNALGFLMPMITLLAFTLGIDVGASLEKRRHCEALAKTSPPMQAPSCRN